jgi:ribosomal-protein-alanine N-acetyltransferase
MSPSHPRDHHLRPLDATDAAWLSALHALCFDEMQRWPADLFVSMLAQGSTRGHALLIKGEPAGFLLGRHVVDEGEILTVAIAPALRRGGLARSLLHHFIGESEKQGATRVFLEVAVNNQAAVALYEQMGFRKISLREKYYQMPAGHEPAFLDGFLMAMKLGGAKK